MADGDIDHQIMASRLVMRVLDDAAELNGLRLRIQHLEQRSELDHSDVLLPEVAMTMRPREPRATARAVAHHPAAAPMWTPKPIC